jgi:hypothetical protein
MTITGITHHDREILLALLDREIATHEVKHVLEGGSLEAESLRKLCIIRSRVQDAVTHV